MDPDKNLNTMPYGQEGMVELAEVGTYVLGAVSATAALGFNKAWNRELRMSMVEDGVKGLQESNKELSKAVSSLQVTSATTCARIGDLIEGRDALDGRMGASTGRLAELAAAQEGFVSHQDAHARMLGNLKPNIDALSRKTTSMKAGMGVLSERVASLEARQDAQQAAFGQIKARQDAQQAALEEIKEKQDCQQATLERLERVMAEIADRHRTPEVR